MFQSKAPLTPLTFNNQLHKYFLGAPVLGCAQPSCVATPDNFKEDSNFSEDVEGQRDGFFREGDRNLKRFRPKESQKLVAVSFVIFFRFLE